MVLMMKLWNLGVQASHFEMGCRWFSKWYLNFTVGWIILGLSIDPLVGIQPLSAAIGS